MRQETRLLLAVLATGLLALAGCSGDDKIVCGDGAKEGAEQCDDGNLTAGDGCSNTCTVEEEPQACGNGVRDIEEACDDGNTQEGDGCQSNCTVTPKPITQCASLPPLTSGATCAVTKAGTGTARLFQGVVLKDSGVLNGGQVLVDGQGIIQCSACDCSTAPGAAEATVISCPQGVISPGLINSHDHITFQGPPRANPGDERYEHRHDWRRGQDGHTRVANPGSTNILITWGELRQVMAGTTSVAGSGGQPGLLRNLDKESVTTTGGNQQGLDEPALRYETFPLGDSGGTEVTSGCGYPGIDSPSAIPPHSAYLPHVGEGIEESARNEFRCVSTTANGGQDLFKPQTAIIHGIAVTAEEIGAMARKGTDLIWSPRSNISLYGDTAMVSAYKQLGVTISLGTDWLQSGSMNVLRELQCADYLNSTFYSRTFTDEELWRMVTANAADMTDTQEKLGRLEPGKVADLAIFRLRTFAASPYRAVITANAEDVVLTLRGGKPLYGDQALVGTLGQGGCEAVDVCGAPKVLCVADEIGQAFSALQTTNASAYPLFFCNQAPKDEPTCTPQRSSTNASYPASVNRSSAYSGARAAEDKDGDAIPDAQDNCPIVFNPIRPMDNGAQADTDKDKLGDACDPCPLAAGTSCAAPVTDDEDGDGRKDWLDNCPYVANADQVDADADGRGDACDACAKANPGAKACEATIYDVKKPVGGVHKLVNQPVSLADVLVTAVGSNGFFVQAHPSETGRYQGPDYSGLFVFTGSAPTVAAGDRITITTATVADFFGQIELTGATLTKNTSGNPLPPPVTVSPADVRTGGPRAAALEGVLVGVDNVYVTKQEPSLGGGDKAPSNEFVVDTTAGTDGETAGLRVNDYFYAPAPMPAVGTKFRRVRGVLDFRNGNSKLEPRNAQDFVAPPPPLVAFGPAGQYVRVGQTGTDAFPRALTVTMGGTYFEDVTVTIESNVSALRAGNNGIVVIPAGMTSAVVPLHPVAQAESVTLTARLDDSVRMTTVRVLGETEQPLVVSVTPTPAVTAPGHSVLFTVKLDRPAPAGTTLDITVNPATLGAVNAASLGVPLNATEATFTFTADAATTDTSGTLTAALGTSNASATVSLTTEAALPKLISLKPSSPVVVVPGATQVFTVTLDAPALYDTPIAVAAVPGTEGGPFGSAPAVVTILKDQTSATFNFTAGSQDDVSGTVKASFDGATFSTPVTIITAPPALESLSPATVQLSTGRTKVFTVTLDRPAPAGGTPVTVALEPATGLGALSVSTLTVPKGATSAQVTFTAGSAAATGKLAASWNGQTLRSDITVLMPSTANHIVISEVAVAGPAGADDEFIELYNPTNQDIDITGWKVQYKSSTGTSYTAANTVTLSPTTGTPTYTIKAHGYFLFVHTGITGGPTPDKTFSFSLSGSTGGGHIRIGPNALGTALNDANEVDKLGYGGGDSPEGTAAPNPPPAGSSYERKAYPESTAASMAVGGEDELKGNGQDSNNNSQDFVIRAVRQPQNSTSPVEMP